jgi:molecular chaperone GrpE
MGRKKDVKITGLDDTEAVAEQTPEEEKDSEKRSDDTASAEEETQKTSVEEELSEEERLRLQIADLEDRLLRAAADFDNYRKRMIRQQDDLLRGANHRVLSELLEVVDNFERALAHTGDENNADAVREGTEMIYGQLKSMLDKHEVQPIKSVGHRFDPEYHEALMQVESDEYEEGVVATEISKGYMIGDRVLRHAKVGVSKGKARNEDNDNKK